MGKNKHQQQQKQPFNQPSVKETPMLNQEDQQEKNPATEDAAKDNQMEKSAADVEKASGASEDTPPVNETAKPAEQVAQAPVETAVVKSAAPVVVDVLSSVRKEVKQTKAVAQEVKNREANTTSFEAFIEKVKADGSNDQKNLVAALESFVEETKPLRVIRANDFVTRQQGLFNVLMRAVEHEEADEFRRQWYIILAFFEQYKNAALGGRHVFRYAESWNQGSDKLDMFQRLVNLIHLTSDPTNRAKGLKSVSLERSLEGNFSEQARQRIQSFYSAV